MAEFGVAMIGAGFMGHVHVEALRRLGIHVVGILGSTEEKSKVAATGLDLSKAYGSFNQVLADDDVQVIHIVTPNRHHFETAKRGLESDRHVLCEKPLAMSSAESEELVRLAAQRPHLAAGVNYNVRFYPLCLEARDRVRNGQLGDVLYAAGSYAQDWLLEPTDYNWRVLGEEVGQLRAMADIGTHWLDLLQSITSMKIASVCADLHTFHPVRYRPTREVETFQRHRADKNQMEPIEVTTEDYGCVMARFEGGARGNLFVSQATAGRKNCLRFELAGTKQALSWNSERPNEMWIGHRHRANEMLIRDPSLLGPEAREAADYPGGHNEGFADSFKQCFRAFYTYIADGIMSGPEPFPTFADGHREIILCEAILASHLESRWVDL